jgi:dimethylaniline monooxygenase (N-oxide forming)
MTMLSFASENALTIRRSPSYLSLIDKNSSFLQYMHDESKLKVHRDTVTHLSNEGVHLASGGIIKAQAVVYATGWQKSSTLFDAHTTAELGLPIQQSQEPLASAKLWSRLHEQADSRVKALLPELQNAPEFGLPPPTTTPYRLYRNVIPPNLADRGDRSIAFTGMLVTCQTIVFSELSALYAVAYLENLLPSPLPSLDAMNEDIALINAWTKARYGDRAVREPLNLTEQTFFHVLCRDLGIQSHRKKGSRVLFGIDRLAREWLTPYRPSDYRGMVDEFLNNRQKVNSHQAAISCPSEVSKFGKGPEVTVEEIHEKSSTSSCQEIAPICHKIAKGLSLK